MNYKYTRIAVDEEEANSLIINKESLESTLLVKLLHVSCKEFLKKINQDEDDKSSNLSLEERKNKKSCMLQVINIIQKDADTILINGKNNDDILSDYTIHIIKEELKNISKYRTLSEYIHILYQRSLDADIITRKITK